MISSDVWKIAVNSTRADDSKIIAVVRDIASVMSIQEDVDALTDWTEEWLLSLNVEKCKIIHFDSESEMDM